MLNKLSKIDRMDEANFDKIRPEVVGLLKHFSGRRKEISDDTEIYHDLFLCGDDVGEFLDALNDEYGVDFSTLEFHDYFPYEMEASGRWLLWFLGFRDKRKKSLTVAHILRAVIAGKWHADISE